VSIIKIALNGANGKMGKELERIIVDNPEKYALVAKINSSSTEQQLIQACTICDIVIDFSTAEALEPLLKAVIQGKARLLVGTTGLKEDHFNKLTQAAERRALLYAPNTSLGANLITELSIKAAKILPQYDVEIIEAHHRFKKDSPSGTALMIGREIAKEKDINFEENAIFNRQGRGKRQDNEIGFSSIRAGGIYGDNKVIFADENEIVTISCSALSRSAFAQGALFAAIWLCNKNPGLYSMKDVLNL
jgi:4-hydroxy-tetrahydrodipicolinate reductase